MSFYSRILITGIVFAAACSAETMDLFDGFATNWRDSWREQKLFSKPTIYRIAQASDRPVLHATSQSSNSALLRKLALDPQEKLSIQLRWRWKVDRCLNAEESEQTRAGDDYVARVCVIFEDSLIPLRTRSLQYVWTSREVKGSFFPSPYSKQVGMIAMRTGDQEAGQWLDESRDLIADYQHYYGSAPRKISAIAIVVDTDNTNSRGEAWFSDLYLDITDREAKP